MKWRVITGRQSEQHVKRLKVQTMQLLTKAEKQTRQQSWPNDDDD